MKRTTILIILVLVTLLVLTGVTLAMESDNYQLDWFTPLTGNGGGTANSANYAVNFTVGQSAIGTVSGTSYDGCLGFWCGDAALGEHKIYLPLVVRNHS